MINASFPLPHSHLKRFLGDRYVGENSHPHLEVFPADFLQDGHSSCFYLFGIETYRLHGIDTVGAKVEGGCGDCVWCHRQDCSNVLVHFAVLRSLRPEQVGCVPPSLSWIRGFTQDLARL